VRWETLPFESLAGDLVSKPPVRWETIKTQEGQTNGNF